MTSEQDFNRPIRPFADTGEALSEAEKISDALRNFRERLGVSAKQSAVIHKIIDWYPEVARDEVLELINGMAREGEVYKYKPIKNGPAYLTFALENTTLAKSDTQDSTIEKGMLVDADLSLAVIQRLLNFHRPGQMVATSQMIKALRTDLAREDLTILQLNIAARHLGASGLVQIDKGTPLAGRRKSMSKAKSLRVLRVGIPDRKSKETILELLQKNLLVARLLNNPDEAAD